MARFQQALNDQIGYEFAASQQYVAIAVFYDSQTLPGLAAHFYRQAVEERNHAMMLVQYLLDADEQVAVPGIEAPKTDFPDPVPPLPPPLHHATTGPGQSAALVALAREEGELVGEQFLHWFLREQREEVSSMSDLLAVVKRASESNVMLAEEYLARQPVGDEGAVDATAPPAAGGAL